MADLNWRQLKKELLNSPPKLRNSPTFQHKQIFEHYIQPNDQTKRYSGKKTYQDKNKTTLFNQYNVKRLRKFANHKQDHDSTFFFPQEIESQRRSLTARKLINDDSAKVVFKSPREMKRSELYECEIGNLVLSGIKKYETQKNLETRSPIDRSFLKEGLNKATSQEKRLLHNESNIFFQDDFKPKTVLPIKYGKPKNKEINVKPYQKNLRIKSEISLLQKDQPEYRSFLDTQPQVNQSLKQHDKISDRNKECIKNKIILRNGKVDDRNSLLELAKKKK